MASTQALTSVISFLRAQGQLRDTRIAAALGLDRSLVRSVLAQLEAQGQISCCSVTRFESGKAVEEIQCRISGYIPPAAPGPKTKR